MSDERSRLLAHLRGQRRHVLGILDGLDEQALRRAVLPSGWSCLGLLQHLAVDDERFWFGGVVAGDPAVIGAMGPDRPDSWVVPAEVPADRVFELYRSEAAASDEIIRRTPLGAEPTWWPEGVFGRWRLVDLRDVILHVITETAVHAGHLDAARELIDGRTWLVLD